MQDSANDGKKCFDAGNANRVFDLRGGSATRENCDAECQKTSSCVAYSGIFNDWCIGCNQALTKASAGAIAYKKEAPGD